MKDKYGDLSVSITSDLQFSLIGLNDDGVSFEDIAKIIEYIPTID